MDSESSVAGAGVGRGTSPSDHMSCQAAKHTVDTVVVDDRQTVGADTAACHDNMELLRDQQTCHSDGVANCGDRVPLRRGAFVMGNTGPVVVVAAVSVKMTAS